MNKITSISADLAESGEVGRDDFTRAFHAAVEVIGSTVVKPLGSWPDQPHDTCALIEAIRKSSGASPEVARAAIGKAVGAFTYIGSLALVADCDCNDGG